jgi:hypothetical protein
VPDKNTKKQLILDHMHSLRLERAGAREIQAIHHALRRQLGAERPTSPSYIAQVLREAGTRVDLNDRFADPAMPEPYASRLKGLLRFSALETAQASLEKIDAIYREYRSASDRIGTQLVRSLVVKGKQRSASVANNPRISPEKRREKTEIARWFQVWLEVSDLFFDWLELRKQSEDFQRLFGHDGHPR